MKVLIIMEGFFPGQKFGGPPVSIDNFCTLMQEWECYIITSNHDMGENKPYPNISSGWNKRENCKVLYLSDKEYGYKKFEKVIQEIKPDIIYLQGVFQSCILPCLFLSKKYNIPTLLAPRGELCEGAFKKKYKKIPYIILLKICNLLKNTYFQSTSEEENESIIKWLATKKKRIFFLNNIPSFPKDKEYKNNKTSGQASFVFLSRIVPKKNLISAIDFISKASGKINFDIYGTLEDKKYWGECLEKIKILPNNIKVEYKGIVEHSKVHDIFSKYDAFIFPTFSENFGHVIAEALMVGCPVIISDQTPWSDVSNFEGGWSIPLSDYGEYIMAIQKIIDSDQNKELLFRENILKYVDKKMRINEIKEKYRTSFSQIIMENNK